MTECSLFFNFFAFLSVVFKRDNTNIGVSFLGQYKKVTQLWGTWLSGKVLDPRARGLGFDSRHTGHV